MGKPETIKGAISYSLFGWNRVTPENCFSIETYIRGFYVNMRINRVLYPNWITILNIDHETYNSPYKDLFDYLWSHGWIKVIKSPDNEMLCKAMLWRLKPVYSYTHPEWDYTHVLFRDTDSIGTYREAQAVTQWIEEDKTIHCITDSISHNIPFMGGMTGVRPGYFNERFGVNTWDELMQLAKGIDFNQKGSDQTFLNRYIYPRCADSSTENFVLGMVHNLPEGNGRHYSIPDIEVPGVDVNHKSLNDCCGHCGSSGYYEPPMLKWLKNIDPNREEYREIESMYPRLFFWS